VRQLQCSHRVAAALLNVCHLFSSHNFMREIIF